VAMPRGIDSGTATGYRPAAIQGFDPTHDAREIFRDRQIAATQLLYSFSYTDGDAPNSGLVLDAAGNLYGTTPSGGGSSPLYAGTVFELSPVAGGVWSETVLRTFRSQSAQQYGAGPSGALIFDAAGNLYGTTAGGGAEGGGTAFELSPQAGDGWAETVIFDFGGADGSAPNSSLISDTAGNFYGTTSGGGTEGGGTVFELSPSASGSWTETVLYNFSNQNNSSLAGQALTFDAAGNLYGAIRGGSGNCSDGCGSIFKLGNSGGVRLETVLFEFDGGDGDNPNGSLVIDSAGTIYGTTSGGGAKGAGTVFEIVP
ncbi:MAG: choice-of-anchor tandem repeat GloVer-containing protein, partial [Candidatus Sulfotelmatobacter sp.]